MPRLLLIDDEPRVARALEFALGGTGVEIVAVRTMADAESQTELEQPDAILLDIGLGNASGLDVCRQLKSDERFKRIPVLLLSGQADATTKAAGFAAGADDFISKPFVPTELLARIEAQLRRRAQ
ncbi:MAG: two-component system, OmpR family, alkaline phosphatase synthesis response regulator PhoP [Chloroflexota bacterium]|jgi:two-component system response regulator MtrA|nr:two-component system, OmpR family, alkaline phosphatase synthesis response regulator PhoP [Chloroflexota bacterium]